MIPIAHLSHELGENFNLLEFHKFWFSFPPVNMLPCGQLILWCCFSLASTLL